MSLAFRTRQIPTGAMAMFGRRPGSVGHWLSLVFGAVLSLSCGTAEPRLTLESPSATNAISFSLSPDGVASYEVSHRGKPVLGKASLGFDFKDAPSLHQGLELVASSLSDIDQAWEMPWGEQRAVRDHCRELTLDLREKENLRRRVSIIFRAYDDGVAFRFHFPEQENMGDVVITDENTQFQLLGDHKVWWSPGDWDSYEHLYTTTNFSGIDVNLDLDKPNHPRLAASHVPENAVNTPVTMKTADGVYLSFHEANLTDYAGMTLKVDGGALRLQTELVGSERCDCKVTTKTPFNTPWRMVQIADRAGDLIESRLELNLNEPNKLGDVSWFKPEKYVGIWWEMHLGKSTWDYAGTQDMNTFALTDLKPTGKHGATTANAKKYIDFAAAHGVRGLLVEGWNKGWEHWIGFEDREGVFDFVTPYKDYDIQEVVRYGREKGVELILHHETSAAPRTYEKQLAAAYQLMKDLGVHSVKTGYVGQIIPKGEHHHGQWMVNHYRKVLLKAAEYQIAVDAHEPIQDTGIRRTYPNAISREGLRGQEFNAWSTDGGNPPEHLSIVAFTRMLAGPIDYTPGIFNIKLKPYKPNNQVNTTLAQQLALYVVIYSPVQMAADLVENYQGNPAFQFITDVGVDWEQSKVLDGEVGDFVVIARQERGTDKWFVGAITDENARGMDVKLDFLEPAKTYRATLYVDGDNADWDKNPTDCRIEEREVDSTSVLHLKLAPGGGAAISLIPAE